MKSLYRGYLSVFITLWLRMLYDPTDPMYIRISDSPAKEDHDAYASHDSRHLNLVHHACEKENQGRQSRLSFHSPDLGESNVARGHSTIAISSGL